MSDVLVAWWNLENLFDHENAIRDAELAQTLRSDLRGWTLQVRNRKLDQLASVIALMADGAGPDLLGVCEVENEDVVEALAQRLALPGRSYAVLHHDSPDARGIDVSFVLDENVLEASDSGHQVVIKRTATRDIFWATITVRSTAEKFTAVANHWPARSAGKYESEPYRMLTGETASYVLSKMLYSEPNLPVLLMGDFNDEPFDRSMRECLLGTRDAGRVSRARSPRVLNLMWPLLGADHPGTFRYGGVWNMLDQFLVSKGFLRRDSRLRVRRDSVEVFRPAVMKGPGGAPRAFGRPANNSLDEDGYSDHYPITVVLRTT